MPNQYTVQAGDTLGAIARRFKVDPNLITGYKSGNPNLITPGENLTWGDTQTSIPNAPTLPGVVAGQENMTPLPGQTPNMSPYTPPVAPQATAPSTQPPAQTPLPPQQSMMPPAQSPLTPPVQAPQQPAAPQIAGQSTPALPQAPEADLTGGTDFSSALDPEFQALLDQGISPTKEQNPLFNRYGLDPDAIGRGFQVSPQGTIAEIIREVMGATGLPDASENIGKISKEIESLENERDDEIRKIQDNPWTSSGSKRELIERTENKYENKIANRTKRLTLIQSAYKDAQEQARFAATTAISLYDKNRTFNQNQLEFMLEQGRKQLESEKGDFQVVTLKDEFGNEYTKVFDKDSGSFIGGGGIGGGVGGKAPGSGTSPVETKASLEEVGQTIASSFTSKFQQQQFLKNLKNFTSKGDTQGAAEYIFSRAIDTIGDADERKKVRGRYEMILRLNRIDGLLRDFQAKGGDTGYFKGTTQSIKERFGQVGDPELASIGTAIASALDELVRFRTGAALTTNEEKFYRNILPGTFKSAKLNEANIQGLRDSLSFDVENSLRSQLTSDGYEQVKSALESSPINPAAKSSGFTASVGGKSYSFPTQKALDDFKKAAGI